MTAPKWFLRCDVPLVVSVVMLLAIEAALLLGCNAEYRVTVPYCPVSDSARAHADSVPFPCLIDSVRAK